MKRTRSVTDSLGRQIEIPVEPHRIVSLCPSQTETLFALGLAGRIVGRTRYCIHPAEEVKAVAVVGGTKKVDVSAVRFLSPDLIIAEKEENTRQDVEALSALAPVYVTNVESYGDALESIVQLGDITDTRRRALEIVEGIKAAFSQLPQAARPIRVLYLIWRKPFMAAGRMTYIGSLIEKLGWVNLAVELPGRYPVIERPELLTPDVVLLSDEPYPFKEKHVPEIQKMWPQAEIRLVRGDYFSWYGVRMIEAAEYLHRLVVSIF
ncbi:MAG: helical backbone metal receptor [Bacteroidia bacterium]|nr:helical backbone metal receptor [Bacteroidia bacterium]